MNKKEIEEMLGNLYEKITKMDDDFHYYKITPTLTETMQNNNIKKLKEDVEQLSSKVCHLTEDIKRLIEESKDRDKSNVVKRNYLERLDRTRANSIFTREEYLEFENKCLLEEMNKIQSENTYLKNVIQEINQLLGDMA
ncbi:hypothetical protein GCM10008931_44340 [Oceanobacillus oncorhynchi subsp. oncorhynchi]|uniref:hypothetical protein n=1 Tax=Oceanobacillus oncorhynchi TaxID=545501 RepID=UPI0031D91BA0